ncbi:MAG: LysR family transcriptional regulator [Oscillospiraceae bacterium]|nr:LysR family transcriptional regulator [Oscillospiraceae bacterium]
MNTRRLQCAIVLSKIRSFSQAAEEMGISQPAFSKQILSLEKDLGVELFHRDVTPVTLTHAGEYFIQEAQELLYKEDRLLQTMERFRKGEAGSLVIGISQFRSLYLIPRIVQRLRESFPGIRVCLHEEASHRLRQEVVEGKYDFAVVNLPVDESLLEVIALKPDTLVLAVPNTMLDKLPFVPEEPLAPIHLTDCGQLPFVVAQSGQEMRSLFDRLCTRFQIHPPVAMEVFSITSCRAMVFAGMGAALLPLEFVEDMAERENVTLFTLKDNAYVRQPAIVYRRGQELSDYVRFAINLICENA